MSYGAVKVFTTSSAGGGLSQKSSGAQPTWYFAGGVLSPSVGGTGGSAPSIRGFFTSISVLTHQGKFFSTALRPSRERAPPGERTRNPRLRFPWGPWVVTVPWTRQHRRAAGASRGRSSARRRLWSALPALRSSAALRLLPRDHLWVITSLSSSESHIPAPLDLRGITPGRNWPVRPTILTASARK